MRTFWFDVDGVLLDLEYIIRTRMYEYLGRIKPNDTPVSSCNFAEALGISDNILGRPTESPNALWLAIWQSMCNPYPWAVDLVLSARASGFKTASLSVRPNGIARWASLRDLLRANIPLDNIAYVNAPHEKFEHFASDDVYIDDQPQHAANAAHSRPDVKIFLLDQPWNAFSADLGDYERITAIQLMEKMNEI